MSVQESTTGPIIVTKRGRVLEVRIERGKANAIDAATSRITRDGAIAVDALIKMRTE